MSKRMYLVSHPGGGKELLPELPDHDALAGGTIVEEFESTGKKMIVQKTSGYAPWPILLPKRRKAVKRA